MSALKDRDYKITRVNYLHGEAYHKTDDISTDAPVSSHVTVETTQSIT